MQATRSEQVYENSEVLFVALELSKRSWRLAFGDGSRRRQVKVEGGMWPRCWRRSARPSGAGGCRPRGGW